LISIRVVKSFQTTKHCLYMRLIGLILCVFSLCCFAQQKSKQTLKPSPDTPRPARVTDFRILGGKLYNAELSTNWVSVASIWRRIYVKEILTNGIICKYDDISTQSRRSANVVQNNYREGQKCFIKNYPTDPPILTGALIDDLR